MADGHPRKTAAPTPTWRATWWTPAHDVGPWRDLEHPWTVRRFAMVLVTALPLVLIAAAVVPWTQTAYGEGEVISFAAAERTQILQAPVSGRIVTWFVTEGQRVTEGDPLVELRDNDPLLQQRMGEEREATEAGRRTAEQQAISYQQKVKAELLGRDSLLAEYESKVRELEGKLVGDEAALQAAQQQFERMSQLVAEGIESQRSFELAQASLSKEQATVEARRQEISAVRFAQSKAREESNGKIASAEAALQDAFAKEAEYRAKLLAIDVKISRQDAQLVRAPRDGTVQRLHGGPGGGQVKQGDTLVTLVPNATMAAVELMLDGNDVALVSKGDAVRLIFEGWPALQVPAWPGIQSGAFHGKVAVIDATDTGKGDFRVVVIPDDEAHDWPDQGRLRQGVRTRGWVMLREVSLGYEVWRQINNFPPLPDVEKGEKVLLPSTKKPRTPPVLQ